MNVYLARQIIVNKERNIVAYEILYRDDNEHNYEVDGSEKTKTLIHNVMFEFGFENISNGKRAFFNFTEKLLFTDVPFLMDKEKIVIELLEDINYTDEVIRKIEELKANKFCFALDDYIGENVPERVINIVDIIKVDFLSISNEKRKAIAKKYGKNKILLAEKIETEEDFNQAVRYGYNLFQGYFFSKPVLHFKRSLDISSITYLKLWSEVSKKVPNLDMFAKIIENDANASYRFLCKANTLKYVFRTRVETVRQALILMGIEDVRRWILLMLLKDITDCQYEECISNSLIRAVFSEKLVEYIGYDDYVTKAYMVGLFSIVEEFCKNIIEEISFKFPSMRYITETLNSKNSVLTPVINFVIAYENANEEIVNDFVEKYNLDYSKIANIYMEAVRYSDNELSM